MIIAGGRIEAVYQTANAGSFVTTAQPGLDVTLDGIPGNRHGGRSRTAGAREPWLKRGFPIRNERQLTVLALEEMAEIARRLGLPGLPPELLGANLVVAGIERLSHVPAGSRFALGGTWAGAGQFDGQVLLRVEGYNHPCRQPGKKLAEHFARPDLEFAFRREAAALRGLVLSVDAPGRILPGDPVAVVPPAVAP